MMDYLQILFASGIVIGMLFILYGIAMKRRQVEKGLINIIAYKVLDHRRGVAVAVMKIGSELLFIGVTPSDMKVLSRVKDTEPGLAGKVTEGGTEVRALASHIRNKLNEDN
jgi:flagellar biogenesis protein FliO